MKKISLALIGFFAQIGIIKMADPTCVTDCSTEELPVVASSECSPTIDLSEVDHIYLTQLGNPLTNVTDLTEWTSRLSDDVGLPTPGNIRTLPVIGEYPAPESSEIKISLNRTVNGIPKHTVNFEVDDLTDKMYDFMRATFCNNTWLAWFAAGSYMYGGHAGIPCRVSMKPSISKGREEPNKLIGTMTWETKFPPERTVNPLA